MGVFNLSGGWDQCGTHNHTPSMTAGHHRHNPIPRRKTYHQWTGRREILQENPMFNGKIEVPEDFPLNQSIEITKFLAIAATSLHKLLVSVCFLSLGGQKRGPPYIVSEDGIKLKTLRTVAPNYTYLWPPNPHS